MCFDDDPFGVVGGEAAEETLTRQMRGLEKRHFSNVTPIDRLEVKNLDGPAELLCIGKERVLRINPAVASYPHLSSVLILHELTTTDGTSATAQAGCLLVLDSNGNVVETITDALINGPWDMTVFDGSGDDDARNQPAQDDQHGKGAALFVTNVLNGTVAGGG